MSRATTPESLKANLSLSLATVVATPELARAHFFSAAMSDEQVRSYQSRMQDDSYRAFLDLVALDLVRTRRVRRTPMLVLGAEDDTLVSPRQVRRTAERYGAEVEILPGIAHDMMLDSRWRTGADRMVAWLDNTFPT